MFSRVVLIEYLDLKYSITQTQLSKKETNKYWAILFVVGKKTAIGLYGFMAFRECRLREEVPDPVSYPFKEYTKKQCLFHCGQNKVREKCGCMPWDQIPLVR